MVDGASLLWDGGSSPRVVLSTTNTTQYALLMSTLMFWTNRRKIAPPFGGFTPTLGGEFSFGLFFVYSTAIFEVASPGYLQRKKGGTGAKVTGEDRSEPTEPAGETAPHFAPGWPNEVCLGLPGVVTTRLPKPHTGSRKADKSAIPKMSRSAKPIQPI
jgi:hypothetical protein